MRRRPCSCAACGRFRISPGPSIRLGRRYDIKFVQAKADAIEALAEFAEPARSKPLFLFLKGGKEVGRMDGANPVELGKLVTKNATKKQ